MGDGGHYPGAVPSHDLLHVENYGAADGPPVLAVHGVTGFGARFQRTVGLIPERRWICPDLRGHGRSTSLPPWRTEDHVAAMVAVLDAHDVAVADVVAPSFGGHLALPLLAIAPDRGDKVLLPDPASNGRASGWERGGQSCYISGVAA